MAKLTLKGCLAGAQGKGVVVSKEAEGAKAQRPEYSGSSTWLAPSSSSIQSDSVEAQEEDLHEHSFMFSLKENDLSAPR